MNSYKSKTVGVVHQDHIIGFVKYICKLFIKAMQGLDLPWLSIRPSTKCWPIPVLQPLAMSLLTKEPCQKYKI